MFLTSTPPTTSWATDVQPPNIVIFLSDDAPFGSLRKDVMPNVWSRIVRRGTKFTHFYVENPLCCPSRATILTGQSDGVTGVFSNGDAVEDGPWKVHGGTAAFHEFGNPPRTVAYELQAYGYATGLFGKYLNHYSEYAHEIAPDDPLGWIPQGWSEWVVFFGSQGAYYDYDLNENGWLSHHGTTASDYSTTLLGRKAAGWIRSLPLDQPFFLLYAPFAPHGPALADPRDVGRFDGAAFWSPAVAERDRSDKPTYLQAVRPRYMSDEHYAKKLEALYSMDRQVGRIMDAIAQRGQSSNTIFLYLSDNGLGWGEHGWISKLVPYERSIRVPAAIRYDGVVPAGAVDPGFASNIDIKATLMALGSLDELSPSQGINIVAADRPVIQINNMYYPRSKGSVPSYCGIVTHRWKYVLYAGSGVSGTYEEELYSRRNDPYELNNRMAHPTDFVLRKARSLRQRLVCPLPEVEEVR